MITPAWVGCSFRLAVLASAYAASAIGGVINGGFESGDFTNWAVVGDTTVVGEAYTSAGTSTPVSGLYQAQLRSGGATASQLAAFLGVAETAIEAANWNVNAVAGAAIRTVVTASAGDTISFHWRFFVEDYYQLYGLQWHPLDEDYLPYDDFAVLVVVGPAVNTVTRIVSAATLGAGSGPTLSGWRTVEFVFPVGGTFALGFAAMHTANGGPDTILFVDGEGGSVNSNVPEPSSLKLCFVGFASALAAAAHSRRRGRHSPPNRSIPSITD